MTIAASGDDDHPHEIHHDGIVRRHEIRRCGGGYGCPPEEILGDRF